jgi:hypothetical protein
LCPSETSVPLLAYSLLSPFPNVPKRLKYRPIVVDSLNSNISSSPLMIPNSSKYIDLCGTLDYISRATSLGVEGPLGEFSLGPDVRALHR